MRLSRDVLAMNLYSVLGVPRNATLDQLRRAYRLQAIVSHPDLHGTPAEKRMVELNVAAFVLLDPSRRAEYDRRRARRDSEAPAGRQAPAPFYPWPEAAVAETGAAEEWVPPVEPARPARGDRDVEKLLYRVRRGPSRTLSAVLDFAEGCSPTTHLCVTCASVCVALLLIASARPKSLLPDSGPEAIACSADALEGG